LNNNRRKNIGNLFKNLKNFIEENMSIKKNVESSLAHLKRHFLSKKRLDPKSLKKCTDIIEACLVRLETSKSLAVEEFLELINSKKI
jgi:hypothetical protein